MITATGDKLTFTFPEVERRLEARLEAAIDAQAARVVSEDRQAAFAAVMSRPPYSAQSPEWTRSAREALDALTDADIDRAYREAAWAAVGGRPTQRPPAEVSVEFQRTLRLPDDGKDHPLPPGLGRFPLRRIEDLGQDTPAPWKARGGVALPMYQGEAMWLRFIAGAGAALKIAAGGVNAVTGEPFAGGLSRSPQDYVALPRQPWLDGFCVAKGVVRQFVAMPLGEGYTAEEQVTGEAKEGGVQIGVVPVSDAARFRAAEPSLPRSLEAVLPKLLPQPVVPVAPPMPAMAMPMASAFGAPAPAAAGGAMGLGAGGRMKQEIYADTRAPEDYATDLGEACFVHVLNSAMWKRCTGEAPPQPPVTAEQYRRYNLPWFDYYRDDAKPVEATGILSKLKSVFAVAKEKQSPVFADQPAMPDVPIVHLGPEDRPGSVRGWRGV
ncbi:MAG: hypothetical protein R3A52_01130 [Polyangiales bacterium]